LTQLSSTHHRISLTEELASKPSDGEGPKTPKSIHTVLKGACKLLQEGQSVCFDDLNNFEKTRASIVAV